MLTLWDHCSGRYTGVSCYATAKGRQMASGRPACLLITEHVPPQKLNIHSVSHVQMQKERMRNPRPESAGCCWRRLQTSASSSRPWRRSCAFSRLSVTSGPPPPCLLPACVTAAATTLHLVRAGHVKTCFVLDSPIQSEQTTPDCQCKQHRNRWLHPHLQVSSS